MGHFEQFGRKEARSPTTVRQGGIGANTNATNRGQITLLVCSGRSGGWVGGGWGFVGEGGGCWACDVRFCIWLGRGWGFKGGGGAVSWDLCLRKKVS